MPHENRTNGRSTLDGGIGGIPSRMLTEKDWDLLERLPRPIKEVLLFAPSLDPSISITYEGWLQRKSWGMPVEEFCRELASAIKQANGYAAFAAYGPTHPQAVEPPKG